MQINDTLKKLCGYEIVSGSEHLQSDGVISMFNQYCDSSYIDKMGNIIGLKTNNKENPNPLKIMIASHIDQIGLMIKDIDDKGFIKFVNIGGIDPRILLGQEVYIHGRKKIFGLIGAKPPHLLSNEEIKKGISIEDLSIDIGYDKDTAGKLVSIGDYISFTNKFYELSDNCVSSISLDNRAGITVLFECMKELENVILDHNIYYTATSQEEVGLRGATTSGYNIYPDIAIAVDVCHGETPDASGDNVFKLNKGPVISIGPNIHPGLVKKLKDIAKEYFIDIQTEVESGSTGTDAWALQVIKCGIPTLLISIPLRYMHTTVETVNTIDIKKAGKLLAFFIKNISTDMEGIICY